MGEQSCAIHFVQRIAFLIIPYLLELTHIQSLHISGRFDRVQDGLDDGTRVGRSRNVGAIQGLRQFGSGSMLLGHGNKGSRGLIQELIRDR